MAARGAQQIFSPKNIHKTKKKTKILKNNYFKTQTKGTLQIEKHLFK